MMAAVFSAHRERNGPENGIATWDPSLWAQLDELGLVRLTGREETGGSGAGWYEAAELVRAPRHRTASGSLWPNTTCSPVGFSKTAGLPMDDARRTVCVLDETGVARRRAVGVPGRQDRHGLARRTTRTSSPTSSQPSSTSPPGPTSPTNPATRFRDTIALVGHRRVADAVIDQLFLRGALIRALQVCAALDRILDLSSPTPPNECNSDARWPSSSPCRTWSPTSPPKPPSPEQPTEAALTEAVRTDWSVRISNSSLPSPGPALDTPHRSSSATPTRYTARSAPPASTGCTSSPNPPWRGARNSDPSTTGTTP